MNTFSPWNVDSSQILTRQELRLVLIDLTARKDRLANVHLNLALVRLTCCCGLRASEIGGLVLDDVRVGVARPYLQVRAETAKQRRAEFSSSRHPVPRRIGLGLVGLQPESPSLLRLKSPRLHAPREVTD
jgi:hypothetical protein